MQTPSRFLLELPKDEISGDPIQTKRQENANKNSFPFNGSTKFKINRPHLNLNESNKNANYLFPHIFVGAKVDHSLFGAGIVKAYTGFGQKLHAHVVFDNNKETRIVVAKFLKEN